MAEAAREGASSTTLTVTRLLQNPLGKEAPAGERGDMVLVSDGRARVYLLASEFDMVDTVTLRWMLARQQSAAPVVGRVGDAPAR